MRNTSIVHLILVFILGNISISMAQPWQQKADYEIDVELLPTTNQLVGKLKLSYKNQAPNALDSLYFHLWPNAYSSKTSPFARQLERVGNLKFRFAKPHQMGRMSQVVFSINGQEIPVKYLDESQEIAGIRLPKPLATGGTISIEVSFTVDIPEVFSRMGHDCEHYCITQWFPKVALFDQKGWHRMPYLDLGEYYDNFGSYEVNITVPNNYVVAATGNLTTESEIEWLNKRVAQTNEAIYNGDLANMLLESTGTKTLHFVEENIHDFAWFANPNYLVNKSIAVLANGHEVEAWSFFEFENANVWQNASQYLVESVKYYSEKVGNYPYKTVKAVAGPLSAGGGMEYPTITVVSGDIADAQRVILHEVGHNWFQGILASNERRYPYLDEGYNSYFENRFYRNGVADPFESVFENISALSLSHMRKRRADMACNLHSDHYDQLNYGLSIYSKTAENLLFLEDYLGTALFDTCMHRFFREWKFKHPGPQDFTNTFERESGKNLGWFFNDVLGSYKLYDYDITQKTKTKGQITSIKISNTGHFTAPFKLSLHDFGGNGLTEEWIENVQKDTIIQIGEHVEQIWINQNLPRLEDNIQRNFSPTQKAKPLKIKLLNPFESPKEHRITIGPAFGYNSSDGTLLGLAILNPVIPQALFEYQLVPLFASDSKNFDWLGNLQRNWFWKTQANRKSFSLGVSSKSFGIRYWALDSDNEAYSDIFHYKRIQPFVNYKFGPRLQLFRMNEIHLRSVTRNFNVVNRGEINRYWRSLAEISYTYTNSKASFPFSINIAARGGDGFAQLRSEIKGSIPYQENKDIRFRFFGGRFLQSPNTSANPQNGIYFFNMTNLSGFYDYMLDGLALDRARDNAVFSRQLLQSDGGLVTPSLGFTSGKQLLSFNISAELPKLPLRFFVNGGFMPERFIALNLNQTTLIEAGLQISIYKDVININMPFLYSKTFQEYLSNNPMDFFERITFTLDFTKLNPVKLAQTGVGSIF